MSKKLKNTNSYKDKFYSGDSEFNYSVGQSSFSIKDIKSSNRNKEIAIEKPKIGAVTDIVKNYVESEPKPINRAEVGIEEHQIFQERVKKAFNPKTLLAIEKFDRRQGRLFIYFLALIVALAIAYYGYPALIS